MKVIGGEKTLEIKSNEIEPWRSGLVLRDGEVEA